MNATPFSSLTLGNITFASNVVQGPLAGYSASPFRDALWQHSNPGFASTEMLSSHMLMHSTYSQERFLHRSERESRLLYQLSGRSPDTLAQATAYVHGLGADIIDLNCGCPVAKIRGKKAGSRHLQSPDTLYELLKAMRSETNRVLSCKIRVSEPKNDHDTKAVVEAIEAAGVDVLIVHGRHWTERYDVPCRYDAIAQVVDLATIPIIANGDAEDLPSVLALFNTGADGVMIARATVGRPWLIKQIQCEYYNIPFDVPDREAINGFFIEHLDKIAKLEGDYGAVLQARSLVKYYFRDEGYDALIKAVQSSESLANTINLINESY